MMDGRWDDGGRWDEMVYGGRWDGRWWERWERD